VQITACQKLFNFAVQLFLEVCSCMKSDECVKRTGKISGQNRTSSQNCGRATHSGSRRLWFRGKFIL